ncbi:MULTISPECIES: FimV/HubP family polar landmark protein [unclassified Herbaspirillum]|uniref:FimV/HubP family polar landmark protein n=1 Tax=unclassified Herbaspirillum TaxID=2624150 RepID=UPI000E2F0A01|nr:MULTISPECIES: FimV/HubP family polar landmark protein [unclassified Herbaspirillum]RFB73991.1 fimbrial protein FimV [Herbaspirillum sp. 3R-3a1]TFI10197.1 fimbrial protein FimV [Herbaspirillum sp. 3R11]TFI16101.1 fimbrial protein FimV [Herbaspirillum sp. 3R-11]TFI25478.1 fimbrial protein FimV [Herbaspirillum sp. 3C11]
MPLHTDNKFPLSRLKKLSAAVTLAVILPMGAHAAGLGKLTVLSALGQPLRAEIELTSVSKDEEGSLVARLAPADAFRKANIDFNPVLSSLRFSVEQRQGRQLIRISSAQALNEPFVDLLLELSGGGTRLVREYTFLLDPPDMRKPQAAQSAPATPSAAAPAVAKPAAAAATTATPAAKPAAAAPAAPAAAAPTAAASSAPANNSDDEPVSSIVTRSAPSPLAEEIIRNGRSSEQAGLTNAPVPAAVAAKTVPQPAAASADAKSEEAAPVAAGKRGKGAAATAVKPEGKAGDKTYRVKEGDTLADIANRTRDNTVSLDQMLIALYRANPDAFIGDNINRLRAGRVLSVPDAAAAGAVNKGEARTTVVAQAQDFNAYRNKLAGQVASGPARKASDAKQSGGGKVTARVEEKSSTNEARDRLQLSKAGAGAKDRAAAEKAAAEDKIAADKAIAEANDRVKALEKNVSDLQKLLEIKNKTLAEMSEQQKAAAAKPEAPAAAPAAAEVKPEAKPEEKPAEAKPAEATPAPAPEPVKPEAAPAPAAAPAVAKPKVAVVPGPVATASFFDRIQDNPFVLPGAGALVALLAAWGVVRVRNNKKKAAAAAASDPEQEDEPAASPKETPPAVEAAAVAAAAVAAQAEEPAPEPVAVVEEPVAPPAAVVVEEPEVDAVDPIEEADMYISFGREEQAEDILQLALKSDPNRQAIRNKLLEIYAKRQDVDAFNDVAKEMHAGTGGIGEEWEKAAALGIVLDPTNPLYGAVIEEEIAPVEEPAPAEPEPDQGLEFDLDDFKGAEIQPGATPPADIGSKIDFDLELDSGVKPEEEEKPAPAAPVLNDIDLDLPPPETPKPVDVLEDDESAFTAEMSTKLDLAAAYQEIGDKEGARELLEEVIRGGNDAQIARARDMLSKLS